MVRQSTHERGYDKDGNFLTIEKWEEGWEIRLLGPWNYGYNQFGATVVGTPNFLIQLAALTKTWSGIGLGAAGILAQEYLIGPALPHASGSSLLVMLYFGFNYYEQQNKNRNDLVTSLATGLGLFEMAASTIQGQLYKKKAIVRDDIHALSFAGGYFLNSMLNGFRFKRPNSFMSWATVVAFAAAAGSGINSQLRMRKIMKRVESVYPKYNETDQLAIGYAIYLGKLPMPPEPSKPTTSF